MNKDLQDAKKRIEMGLYSQGDVSMVFAHIERLEANSAIQEQLIQNNSNPIDKDKIIRLTTENKMLKTENERLKVMLDKAAEDMRRCRRNKCDYCYYSNKNQNTPCRDCQSPISNCGDRWKWRGLDDKTSR